MLFFTIFRLLKKKKIQTNQLIAAELFLTCSWICRRKRVYFYNFRYLKSLEVCFVFYFYFLFITFLKWWKKLHIFKHFFFWNKERRGVSFYRLLLFLYDYYTDGSFNFFTTALDPVIQGSLYQIPNFYFEFFSNLPIVRSNSNLIPLFFFDFCTNNFNPLSIFFFYYETFSAFRSWFLYIRKTRLKLFRYFLLFFLILYCISLPLFPFFYIFFCRKLKKPRKKKRRSKKFLISFFFKGLLKRQRYGFLKHFLLQTKRSVLNSFFLSTIFFKVPSFLVLIPSKYCNYKVVFKFNYNRSDLLYLFYHFYSFYNMGYLLQPSYFILPTSFSKDIVVKHCNFFTLIISKYEPLTFFNIFEHRFRVDLVYCFRCYLLILFFLIL